MSPLTIALLVVGGLLALPILLILVFFLARLLFNKPLERSTDEVIAILRRAAAGKTGTEEWDYFVSVPICDPELDRIREICFNELWLSYSFTEEDEELGWFSNPVARDRLNELIATLEGPRTHRPAT